MWCETAPLMASPIGHRHEDRQMIQYVLRTRVEMKLSAGCRKAAKKGRMEGVSSTWPPADRHFNRLMHPASGGDGRHPKIKNRGHCSSHTGQATQATPTTGSR